MAGRAGAGLDRARQAGAAACPLPGLLSGQNCWVTGPTATTRVMSGNISREGSQSALLKSPFSL